MEAPDGTAHVYVVAPLTLEIEYATPVWPVQTAETPVIDPAAPTFVTVTARLLDPPLPPGPDGVTDTFPEMAPHPKLTMIEVVP